MSSYHFGPFTLEPRERRLLRNGDPVSLTPKVFDTLLYLVERHGRLVGKDELLQAIWGDAYVEEGSLPRTIHILRKALSAGEDEERQRQYIETVPTKGYRFASDVTTLEAEPLAPVSPVAAGTRWRWPAAAGLLMLALAGTAWGALDQRNLSSLPGSRRLEPPTDSGAAYAKFQSGRLHIGRRLPGDIETALADFEAAIQLDRAFAAAHAGRADARFSRYWDTGAHDDIAQARLAVREAIELDGESAYAHAVLCRLQATYDWEFAAAETECRRAVQLDPQSYEARRELAFLMNAMGRRDEALKEMDAAIAIAPSSFNKRSRGVLLYFDRRFDEAIAQLRQVEATDQEYLESSRWIARCFEQKKDYEQALAYLMRFRRTGPEDRARLRRAFQEGGWPRVLRASLPSSGAPVPSLDAAATFAQLGEIDSAFAVLEAMISARQVMVVHMKSEPRLDPLRSDPRFEQLAGRVGLP